MTTDATPAQQQQRKRVPLPSRIHSHHAPHLSRSRSSSCSVVSFCFKSCCVIAAVIVVALAAFAAWQAVLFAAHCWAEWQAELHRAQHTKSTGMRYKFRDHCLNMTQRAQDERAGFKDCAKAERLAELDAEAEARRRYVSKSMIGQALQVVRNHIQFITYAGIIVSSVALTVVCVVLCQGMLEAMRGYGARLLLPQRAAAQRQLRYLHTTPHFQDELDENDAKFLYKHE
jgi:hypothetical protein